MAIYQLLQVVVAPATYHNQPNTHLYDGVITIVAGFWCHMLDDTRFYDGKFQLYRRTSDCYIILMDTITNNVYVLVYCL